MNTYGSKLALMGKNIGKAFGIAVIVGFVISICAGYFGESIGTGIECTLAFGIVLGSIFSLVTTAKAGTLPSLANIGISFVRHLFLTCLGFMGSLGVVGLIVGVIGMVVTVGAGLVIVLFLSISLPLTLLYLTVMTVLERMDRLPGAEVALILDKAVPIVCGVASVIITWKMFSGM